MSFRSTTPKRCSPCIRRKSSNSPAQSLHPSKDHTTQFEAEKKKFMSSPLRSNKSRFPFLSKLKRYISFKPKRSPSLKRPSPSLHKPPQSQPNLNHIVNMQYNDDLIGQLSIQLAVDRSHIQILKQLSDTEHRKVYIASIQGREMILKIERFGKEVGRSKADLAYEFQVHQHFFNSGIGVSKPYFMVHIRLGPPRRSRYFSVTGMRIEPGSLEFGMLRDILSRKVSDDVLQSIASVLELVIKHMCEHNLVHGDLHYDNIGLQLSINDSLHSTQFELLHDGKTYWVAPLIIDFGFSLSRVPCYPEIEIIQLIRTLYPGSGSKDILPHNRNVLYQALRNMMGVYAVDKSIVAYLPDSPTWSDSEYDTIIDPLHNAIRRHMNQQYDKIQV